MTRLSVHNATNGRGDVAGTERAHHTRHSTRSQFAPVFKIALHDVLTSYMGTQGSTAHYKKILRDSGDMERCKTVIE